MSQWSSCNAILGIYTYRQLPNFEELVRLALNTAPRITGSEGDCEYTIIDLQKGTSVSYPCDKCPIHLAHANKRTKNSCPGTYSEHSSKSIYKNCMMHELPYEITSEISGYYDRCKIVVSDMHGLRDKSKVNTIKEFKDLVKHLKTVYKGIFVVEVICKSIT